MREEFRVRVADSSGKHIKDISYFGSTESSSLEYILNVGKPSACVLVVPASEPTDIFGLDGRLTIWRTAGNYGPFLEGEAAYLIRKWKYTKDTTTITAYHANTLTSRRVVAYDKTTTYSDKSTATPADNLVKALWRENAGSSISAANRDGAEEQADISAYVTVQADRGNAAVTTVQAGRRILGEVIDELSNLGAFPGGYFATEIVAVPDPQQMGLELRTYWPWARGADRRAGTSGDGTAIIFSEERGTLANVELTVDRTDEKTVVIAVGAGDDDLRLVQVAVAGTLYDSPLNRIEAVLDLSNIDDDNQLASAAASELRNHRPVIYLTGEIPEGSPLIRGYDYNYGDAVTAEFRGVRYDCRLDSIRVNVGYSSRTTQVILRSIQ